MDYNTLKLYRKQNGFTQEQVAERLGVSRQAVAIWERGDSLPDIDNIIALADMYEVSIDSRVPNMTVIPNDKTKNEKKHLFGVTRVNDKGQITLPKKCREIFQIKPGDKIIVLGDEQQGIAMIKADAIYSFHKMAMRKAEE